MVMQGNGAEQSGDHGEAGSVDSQDLMGVRVVIDGDPATAAARLAEEINGELIVDIETARSAFAARASAGRADPAAVADVELDTFSDGPAIDDDALAELRGLADALSRTGRIRVRTEVVFTESLNRRLSASSGMAVHPEAIKQAATTLTAAEAEVSEINGAIAALGDRPTPELVQMRAPAEIPTIFDDDDLEQRRRARVLALSVATIFAGVALFLVSRDLEVVIPVAVFLVGLIVAGAIMARSYSGGPADDPGAREASALLASIGSTIEDTSEASVRNRFAEEEWMARRSQYEAAGERAVEKARSARRYWETLAGAEADPYDVDHVLRLHDPSLVITDVATKTSPTVRTVNAVHRKAMARWKVAWAALGYEQPPALEDFEGHIARLTGGAGDAEAEQLGQQIQAAAAWAAASAIIDRPMILVEPESWLPEEELEAMLRTLPAGAEVVIVSR